MHVYSISLGCPKNRVDTEHLLGSLGISLQPASSIENADFIFINTCGFIEPAVQESIRTIFDTITECTENTDKKPFLIVAGCMVGRYGAEELANEIPEVDLWLSNNEITTWPEQVCRALKLNATPAFGRLLTPNNSYAWLKISDGCRHKCAFCTIPTIRGPLRSTPTEHLVDETKLLLESGVKEVVLVAQDLTDWGKDFPDSSPEKKYGLRHLLEKLLPLDGLARLRLLYMYPTGLTDDMLSFMEQAHNSPLVPYFDIPLQHAAPDVLEKMGRPFAHNPYKTIEQVRKYIPHAALRTSLIVGFPQETEKDFAYLSDFIEQTRFMHLGVFMYKPEDGTKAATMAGQIPEPIKQERHNILMEQQSSISEEILEEFLGQELEVLVDAEHPEWPGLFTGRTWFQAPEIDGVTYISGENITPNILIKADIVETKTYDLVALA